MTAIEEILAMDDSHSTMVTVPEWNNAQVRVCSMTARERSDIERKWTDSKLKDPEEFRLQVLQKTLKKHGESTPWGTPEQIAGLMDKNAGAVERLFEAACEVNGFTGKDVEELTKN